MAAPKANSKNSHLPPSKDLNDGASPKPKEKGATKKKRGAQESHERRARKKFTPEDADCVFEHGPEDATCSYCNVKMDRDPKHDSQFDQLEIPPISWPEFAAFIAKAIKAFFGLLEKIGQRLTQNLSLPIYTILRPKGN
jgi:hypothetical protein